MLLGAASLLVVAIWPCRGTERREHKTVDATPKKAYGDFTESANVASGKNGSTVRCILAKDSPRMSPK